MSDTVFLREVASTNDYLKGQIGLRPFDSVAALRQTGGKGSKGRSFCSPYGGLYLSVYLEPDKDLLPLVTPMAAVAVRRAVRSVLSVDLGIKWVNDLVKPTLGGYKKVCGILTEGITDDKCRVIVGMGINVFRSVDGYGGYDEIVGWLRDGAVDESVLRTLSKVILTEISRCMDGADFMTEYAQESVLVGKVVRYVGGDLDGDYYVKEIDARGRMVLEVNNNAVVIDDGEVVLWQK
ncbi:MAG: biotin--[Clostridia bacterium]|nr:biotin--[acetyl-CoA-carboxylase] ligase [Clostridia bacterium]